MARRGGARSERDFLHLPDRERGEMAGRNARHLGQGGRRKRRPGGRNRPARDRSRRLGGGPCARTENVFRHHSLRTAPPRLQRRPRFRDRKQRQIPRPDRNRHQDTPRGGVGTGPPQRAGCNAHTHPALLRLRDRGRSPTERQDLQLGIRPEELQRSGRHYSPIGRPRGTHPEFKQMVQSLHRNGMRIVLDVVYNHMASVEHSISTLPSPATFTATTPTAPIPTPPAAATKRLRSARWCGTTSSSPSSSGRRSTISTASGST
ncbi:MAG: alpha-amylase family glycosyl hydrolase [Alistipes finegoldii]